MNDGLLVGEDVTVESDRLSEGLEAVHRPRRSADCRHVEDPREFRLMTEVCERGKDGARQTVDCRRFTAQ